MLGSNEKDVDSLNTSWLTFQIVGCCYFFSLGLTLPQWLNFLTSWLHNGTECFKWSSTWFGLSSWLMVGTKKILVVIMILVRFSSFYVHRHFNCTWLNYSRVDMGSQQGLMRCLPVTWPPALEHLRRQWRIWEGQGQTWSRCLRRLERRLDILQRGQDWKTYQLPQS